MNNRTNAGGKRFLNLNVSRLLIAQIRRRLPMSKFEWVELETLSAEVTNLQTRIEAARKPKNYGLVRLLETELAAAIERQGRLLADIAAGLSNAHPAGTRRIDVPTQKLQPEEAEQKQEPAGPIETNVSHNLPSTNSRETTSTGGDLEMWDRLTAADLQRIKRGVATRRAEMLARTRRRAEGVRNSAGRD